jgi:hypothetical protein
VAVVEVEVLMLLLELAEPASLVKAMLAAKVEMAQWLGKAEAAVVPELLAWGLFLTTLQTH